MIFQPEHEFFYLAISGLLNSQDSIPQKEAKKILRTYFNDIISSLIHPYVVQEHKNKMVPLFFSMKNEAEFYARLQRSLGVFIEKRRAMSMNEEMNKFRIFNQHQVIRLFLNKEFINKKQKILEFISSKLNNTLNLIRNRVSHIKNIQSMYHAVHKTNFVAISKNALLLRMIKIFFWGHPPLRASMQFIYNKYTFNGSRQLQQEVPSFIFSTIFGEWPETKIRIFDDEGRWMNPQQNTIPQIAILQSQDQSQNGKKNKKKKKKKKNALEVEEQQKEQQSCPLQDSQSLFNRLQQPFEYINRLGRDYMLRIQVSNGWIQSLLS